MTQSIQNSQFKESDDMPSFPMYSDELLSENIKIIKKTRKKPRPLTPPNVITEEEEGDNIKVFKPRMIAMETPSCSSSATPSKMGSNLSMKYKQNSNEEIKEKLDLLMNIIASQQKVLINLVTKMSETEKEKKAEKEKESKAKTVDQSTQTMAIKVVKPHIIHSDPASIQQSPFNKLKFPPIPESQSIGNTLNNSSSLSQNSSNHHTISVPYDSLLKLVLAATHKVQPQPPPVPTNYQYAFNQNNNGYQDHHHLDCNSTLHFSD